MKKINYYLGALALASLGLASCSSDNLTAEPELGRTDVERDIYVNISIHGNNPGGSRSAEGNGTPDAADFASGAAESSVKTVYLIFYDAVGNVVGEVNNPLSPTWANNATGQNVESVGKETVKVTLAVGQQQPSFVMCYINPTNVANLAKPLNQLATTTCDAVQNPDGSFPMSNSAYFDEYGNVACATSIAGKYYSSKELADAAADNGESVDIYVERYATKLQINDLTQLTIPAYATGTMTAEALQNGGAMTDVTLKFNPTGWEVNGRSENTYAIKSFRKESDNGQVLPDEYSFDEMNARVNGTYTMNNGTLTLGAPLTGADAWTWNAPEYYRSYWGCSPVYFQSDYPEVTSDYVGNEDMIAQTFFSYEEITETPKEYGKDYYFPETTVGARGLFSANPNAAVASVVIVGTYSVTVGGTAVPEGTTFYTYVPVNVGNEQHPSVYFEVKKTGEADDENGESEVAGTLSMRNRFLWQNSVLYKNTGTSAAPVYARYDMTNAGDVEKLVRSTDVLRPDDDVLAMAVADESGTMKMAERTRTLQITEEATLDGLFINDNGVVKQIVANGTTIADGEARITLDRANLILWQNVGTCSRYDGSVGFFNIPVKHLGWYRQGNAQKDDAKIDFAKVRVGDIGMVRNHAYSINVTSITGLASGIGSQASPIIPPAETQDVYVSYRVNVLQWAVVPTQDVEL